MKKFWSYILITFGLGWLLQCLACLAGGAWFSLINAVVMLTPFVAAWIVSGGLKREKSGIRWKLHITGQNIGAWLAAWFLPTVLAVLGAVLYFLLFPARFDRSMPALTAQLAAAGQTLPFKPWVFVLITLAEALSFAPIVNMFFAVGEEAGWRGWMTPFLTEKLGRRLGLLVSGCIWGLWHAPVIVFAGYNFGTGYLGAPFTGPLIMCVGCMALGIMLTFLYEKTECIWAPALAHGAFNAVAAIGAYFLRADVTSMALGPSPLGLIAGLPMFALALIVLLRKEKE